VRGKKKEGVGLLALFLFRSFRFAEGCVFVLLFAFPLLLFMHFNPISRVGDSTLWRSYALPHSGVPARLCFHFPALLCFRVSALSRSYAPGVRRFCFA
jgi:hypothetical protein